MNMRFGAGGVLQGGIATGSQRVDRCFVVDSPGALSVRRCTAVVWRHAVQGIRSLPAAVGPPGERHLSGQLADTNQCGLRCHQRDDRAVAGAQPRPCGTRPTCTATATVELVPLGTHFLEPRIRRSISALRVTSCSGLCGSSRSFDLYNAFNANPVTGIITRYGAAWQNATSVLNPRTVKFGMSMTF